MKIYGLFRYTYDWHEFERILRASESVQALEAHYADIKQLSPNCDPLVTSAEAHSEFAQSESNHYHIRELTVI